MIRHVGIAVAASAFLLLGGCFFFLIPGGVTSALSDSLTGAEGAHCVSDRTKVGDTFKRADGGKWTVKSLSGVSSRCTNPERPIRALLTLD